MALQFPTNAYYSAVGELRDYNTARLAIAPKYQNVPTLNKKYNSEKVFSEIGSNLATSYRNTAMSKLLSSLRGAGSVLKLNNPTGKFSKASFSSIDLGSVVKSSLMLAQSSNFANIDLRQITSEFNLRDSDLKAQSKITDKWYNDLTKALTKQVKLQHRAIDIQYKSQVNNINRSIVGLFGNIKNYVADLNLNKEIRELSGKVLSHNTLFARELADARVEELRAGFDIAKANVQKYLSGFSSPYLSGAVESAKAALKVSAITGKNSLKSLLSHLPVVGDDRLNVSRSVNRVTRSVYLAGKGTAAVSNAIAEAFANRLRAAFRLDSLLNVAGETDIRQEGQKRGTAAELAARERLLKANIATTRINERKNIEKSMLSYQDQIARSKNTEEKLMNGIQTARSQVDLLRRATRLALKSASTNKALATVRATLQKISTDKSYALAINSINVNLAKNRINLNNILGSTAKKAITSSIDLIGNFLQFNVPQATQQPQAPQQQPQAPQQPQPRIPQGLFDQLNADLYRRLG